MTLATRLTVAIRSKATMAVAVLMAAASMATAPAPAQAGSITYTTAKGATTTGGSVDAKAVFTLKTNEVDITLTNLLWNPTDDAQMISALKFNVSGASGTNTASLTSSSGNTSTISSGGSYTSGVATNPLPAWNATNAGTSLELNALTGGKPKDLIIGPDSAGGFSKSGSYSNANSSIIVHDPVVLGSATFVIDIKGVTSDSQLGSVVFQFGTTSGSNQSDGVLSVPEPSTMAMGLSAMAMVAGALVRRRRRSA